MSQFLDDFNYGTADQINAVVVRLLLQQAFILNTVSEPGIQQTRFTQMNKLRMLAKIDPRDLRGAQFHRGVTAIGVDHPDWRALTLRVLEEILRVGDAPILIDPSVRQVLDAETIGSASALIVNGGFKRKTICERVHAAGNDSATRSPAIRSIILTYPAVASLAVAERVAARARSLSRKGWRVLILCDDATKFCHCHRDCIDQVLQTRGIMPWVLKRICQQGTQGKDIYKPSFLTAITPYNLHRVWKSGITTAALRIRLEESIFSENGNFER